MDEVFGGGSEGICITDEDLIGGVYGGLCEANGAYAVVVVVCEVGEVLVYLRNGAYDEVAAQGLFDKRVLVRFQQRQCRMGPRIIRIYSSGA